MGKEGKGFNIAMAGLNGGRVNIASCSLGGAQKAVLAAKDQLNVRHAFGKPLVEQQYLQYRMAELATQLVTSRVIVRHAASAIDNKDPAAAALCAMAKLHATDECFHVANGCLQMFGGYGYLKDYPGKTQTQLRTQILTTGIFSGTNCPRSSCTLNSRRCQRSDETNYFSPITPRVNSLPFHCFYLPTAINNLFYKM